MGTDFTPLSEYNIEDIVKHLTSLNHIVLAEGEFTELVPDLMVLKVQQSLSSSDNEKHILLYNQDRSLTYQTSIPKEIEQVTNIIGDSTKEFVYALVEESQFKLLTLAPYKEW